MGGQPGSYVNSLVLTDIASGWTEAAPLVVRESGLLVETLERTRQGLPFALRAPAAVESAFHYNDTPWNRLSYGFKKAAMEKLFKDQRVQIAVGALNLRRPPIQMFSYEPSVDIAMFAVLLPSDIPRPEITVLAINSDTHTVDQPVMSVGGIKGPTAAALNSEIDEATAIDFQALSGRIVSFGRSNSFIFYPQYKTNIPTTPGMSGGPVLVGYPKHNTMGAIGVISNDLHVTPPITDTSQPGATNVSPMRAAYLLGFDVGMGRTVTFEDLCESQQVIDIGTRWRHFRVERIPGDPPQWRIPADSLEEDGGTAQVS